VWNHWYGPTFDVSTSAETCDYPSWQVSIDGGARRRDYLLASGHLRAVLRSIWGGARVHWDRLCSVVLRSGRGGVYVVGLGGRERLSICGQVVTVAPTVSKADSRGRGLTGLGGRAAGGAPRGRACRLKAVVLGQETRLPPAFGCCHLVKRVASNGEPSIPKKSGGAGPFDAAATCLWVSLVYIPGSRKASVPANVACNGLRFVVPLRVINLTNETPRCDNTGAQMQGLVPLRFLAAHILQQIATQSKREPPNFGGFVRFWRWRYGKT